MTVRIRAPLPLLDGATVWVNGGEPTRQELAGKPVLVHFWTVSCAVCHDVAHYLREWRTRFESQGLYVISVHQPRAPEERDVAGVIADAGTRMRIRHQLAIDNDHAIVKRFDNEFVPAYYVFDREHKLRHFQAGDKGYDRIEAAIERVIVEEPETAKI
jgi:thiol-disulfide isomerase/thioredoxin